MTNKSEKDRRQMSPQSVRASNVIGVNGHLQTKASNVIGVRCLPRGKASKVMERQQSVRQGSGVKCLGDECPGRQKCINPSWPIKPVKSCFNPKQPKYEKAQKRIVKKSNFQLRRPLHIFTRAKIHLKSAPIDRRKKSLQRKNSEQLLKRPFKNRYFWDVF